MDAGADLGKGKSGGVGVTVLKVGIDSRKIWGKGSWGSLNKCDDLGEGVSKIVGLRKHGPASELEEEEKGKNKRVKTEGDPSSREGVSKIGDLRKHGPASEFEENKVVKTEGDPLSRDLKHYFPSSWVHLMSSGGSYCIKPTYPLSGVRKRIEIVKGKQLEEDAVSLLSNGVRRNYLVRNNGVKESVHSCIPGKYLLICCFKVPLPVDLLSTRHCHAMIAAYSQLVKSNQNFEMVMVAKMASATMEAVGGGDEEAAFNRFFDAFPCLAVPFWDTESRDFLCSSIGLTKNYNHYAAVLLDPHQVVLQTDGACFLRYGARGFPYTHNRLTALRTEYVQIRDRLDFLHNDGKLATPVSLVQLLGSDIPLSRFGGGDTISALDLSKKKCVALYLCVEGSFMEELEGIRERIHARELEFEILVVPVPFSWDTTSFANAVRLALERQKLSSWWVMPDLVGDEEATRRLWQLSDWSEFDRVFFLADGGKAVELDGMQFIETFGRSEYPFTRMTMANDFFNRLRAVKLESLLLHPCINSAGDFVPVSQLKGKKVVIYLDWCKNVCKGQGRLCKKLLRRYNKISKDLELIWVSLDCNCAMDNVGRHPWLVFPHAAQLKDSITRQLFPDTSDPKGCLVAFGEDGVIRSRSAECQLPRGDLFTDTIFQEIVDYLTDWLRCYRGIY